MFPPDDLDPQARYRSELPALPKEHTPPGYRPGWQLYERLQGVGVILLGLIGLVVAYGAYSGVLPVGLPLPAPPQPRGVLVQVPGFNAAMCFMPLLAIGSVALIVVGFRQVLDP